MEFHCEIRLLSLIYISGLSSASPMPVQLHTVERNGTFGIRNNMTSATLTVNLTSTKFICILKSNMK